MDQSSALAYLSGAPPAREPGALRFHLKWVDAAKGFGIILVVFGHALRGLVSSEIISTTPIVRFVDDWIYAFHMPLFFFLSGLFLFRSTPKPWLEFVSDKLRSIAYPYFLWSVITLIFKATLGGVVNHPYDLKDFSKILYQPIDQFWFLYALFVLLIVNSTLLRLKIKPSVVFILAIFLYPGLLPISSLGLGIINMTRLMAIYFALGVLVGSERNIRTISRTSVYWLLAGVLAGLIISSLAAWPQLPYRHTFLATSAFGVSGIVAVVAAALLSDSAKLGSAIRFSGRYSLEIYLVHTIATAAVRISLTKFAHISAFAPHLVLGTLAGIYIPIAVARLCDRVGFKFGFTLARTRKPQSQSDASGMHPG